MNYYRVTLPQGYDPRQTYPLFVICSTKEYGTFGARFAAENPDNLIVADRIGSRRYPGKLYR